MDSLPIDLIQTITSFLSTKQAIQTTILSKKFLQAWSTLTDLNFCDTSFVHKPLEHINLRSNASQEVEKAREEEFANYVDHTLTRCQEQNIPIRKMCLTTSVVNDKIDDILEQCICKAKENRVKEVYLSLIFCVSSSRTLLQTIFQLKELVDLKLTGRRVFCNYGHFVDDISCSFLRRLELVDVEILPWQRQKLIHECPLIEELTLLGCRWRHQTADDRIQEIVVDNLPKIKYLHFRTRGHQLVYVNAANLETLIYETNKISPIPLIIEQTRNLKNLTLCCKNIMDGDLNYLIARFPLLEELSLEKYNELRKINVSSHSLRILSVKYCQRLTEVNMDAPNLTLFEYAGETIPCLPLGTNFGKRESHVSLSLYRLEASSFIKLREFLMKLRRFDTISLYIKSAEISFHENILHHRFRKHKIPEFEEVAITVSSSSSSSTYSTLMEGLLWSFSPKTLSVKCDSDKDEDFIKYLCKKLLVEHNQTNSTSSDMCWSNYFKQAKFEDRDDEWRPLHSWKNSADALRNLGDHYILKFSQVERV